MFGTTAIGVFSIGGEVYTQAAVPEIASIRRMQFKLLNPSMRFEIRKQKIKFELYKQKVKFKLLN
jgi:hypothetical protein